ncbi:MAG: tRNA threonylcarbamoyladenosine dehydratase [Clostridia bacterium]|nr:tRNA threonylcarbamoyladenosine dehydratase [Clostridia bacterium]
MNEFSRTAMLLGDEAMQKLNSCTVAVFGVGGVGSYTVEALARAGVGKIVLIDNDTVSLTNINRQLIATHSTVGMDKVEVVKNRILDINPSADVTTHKTFYTADNADAFEYQSWDYIVDAIDTVSSKLILIEKAAEHKIPIISSMGTGNKLDPTKFEITDIFKTSVCPLARVMRYELKKRGIKKLKVLYSTEQPLTPDKADCCEQTEKRQIPGSVSFVPSVAGLIIAGEVIKDFIK